MARSDAGAAAEDRSPVDSAAGSPAGEAPEPASASRQGARAAACSLERFGPFIGWGLLVLGLLSSLSRGLEWALARSAIPDPGIKAVVDAVFPLLAFGLAGLGTALLGRLAAALIIERIDRATRASEELTTQVGRVVEALGRILAALERRAEQPTARDGPDSDRERALAEIDRATRAARWAEAESLLDAFEAKFPDDPALAGSREQLAAGRRRAAQEQMAQLEAARQVNDPARVLELYQAVGPALELDRRGALERDLARWFLNLIHRRLRASTIQPEVVALATQVAELFGATVEGASLRAALPTLRRSVGLCPRCAQPYTGSAEACPRCLAGGQDRSPRAAADQAAIPAPEDHVEADSDEAAPWGDSD